MKLYLETRKQKAKGKWPKIGPDIYVAVQIVPDNVEKLKNLNYKIAQKRNIEIKFFGEGYSNRSGPNSRLGKAIQKAKNFIDTYSKNFTK